MPQTLKIQSVRLEALAASQGPEIEQTWLVVSNALNMGGLRRGPSSGFPMMGEEWKKKREPFFF
jgi:hypothetical protein